MYTALATKCLLSPICDFAEDTALGSVVSPRIGLGHTASITLKPTKHE